MSNAIKITLASIVLCINLALVTGKELVYVPNFETIGCDLQGTALADRFATYINASGRFEATTGIQRDNESPVERITEVRENAEVLNAKYYVWGKVNCLADHILLTVDLYSAASGQVIWTQQLQSDHSSDLAAMLDKCANRLGLNDRESWSSNPFQLGAGPRVERRDPLRWSIGLQGGGWFYYQRQGPTFTDVLPGFGLSAAFDNRSLILETTVEAYFHRTADQSAQTDLVNGLVRCIYPILEKRSTPIVFADLGYSYDHSSYLGEVVIAGSSFPRAEKIDSYTNNALFGLGLGYLIQRDSRARIQINARGLVLFDSFTVNQYDYASTFNVVVYFGN